MKRRVLLFLTVVLVSLGAGAFTLFNGWAGQTPASAKEPWVIRVFDATYEIQTDGSVKVTEAIKVDFSGLDVDGIYRTLPLAVDYLGNDGQSHRRALKIDVEKATAYSEPVPFTTRQKGGSLVLHVDRDCTCRTQIEYAITYTVQGALESVDGVDRFRWNVTGRWPVDILRSGGQVLAPAIRDANCALTTDGSNSACRFQLESESNATFDADRLPFGADLTINVALPQGAVDVAPPLLVESKSKWPGSAASLGMAGGIAVLLVSVVLLLRDHLAARLPR